MDVTPPGAPRKQKRGGGFDTKGAAIKAMHEVQRAHEEGTAVERTKLTTGQHLASWLEQIKPSRSRRGRDPLRPGTWEEWIRRLRNYVIPPHWRHPVAVADRGPLGGHVPVPRNQRVGARHRRAGPLHCPLDPLTLHAELEDALGRKPVPLVNRNVSDRLYTAPSTPDEEIETWTAEELGTFLTSVKTDEHYAPWRLAAMTGARRGELLALRWRDVDLGAGTVTINRGRVKGLDGTRGVGRTKSERSRRTIDVDPATIEALAVHRRAQDLTSIDGYIFTCADGKPLHPDGVTQRFNYRAGECGCGASASRACGTPTPPSYSRKACRSTW